MSRSTGDSEAGSHQGPTARAPRRPSAAAAGMIARIWHGRTRASVADEYTNYLYEEGIRAIARVPGNRGVQMFREIGDEFADFQVLSYWDSLEAVKRFAGDDYLKVRHLPDDPKYMTGAAPTVRHFEVVVNDWLQR
jgi:heme-degrading monooxygenase HmoA